MEEEKVKRQTWSLCVREEGREGGGKGEIEHGCGSSRRRRTPPLY
jgi:hypothetical protein